MWIDCRGHQPPPVGDPTVQAFLRRLTPACLSKTALSKGIQHPDALVRYTTLCTLLKIVQTVQAELHSLQTDIQSLAASPAQVQTLDVHDSGLTASTQYSDALHDLCLTESGEASEPDAVDAVSAAAAAAFAVLQQQQQQEVPFLNGYVQQQAQSLHSQWTGFLVQLQQSLRASLPDPQSLLAVLSTLYRNASQVSPNNAEANHAADALMHDSPPDDSALLHQAPETAITQANGGTGFEMELDMTGPGLTSSVVLMVLTSYQYCLPEAMSDSHVDVFSLMAQVSCELRVFAMILNQQPP